MNNLDAFLLMINDANVLDKNLTGEVMLLL